MEKIDILLATYNGEKYIRQQLDSILIQTYYDFRLIVSDDCSHDKTVEIIKEYIKNDNRIVLYEQKVNIGSTNNFQFLLEKVENNLYMLSDQDDVWYQNKIEESIKKLKEANADLVFTDAKVVDENLNEIYPSLWKKIGKKKKIEKYCGYKMLILDNCITGCTILSKKEFLKDILPLPLNSKYVIHDYWIATIISLQGKIAYVDQPLILYRQHGNNQVGTEKLSTKMNKFEHVRNHFLKVKIEHFQVFLNNNLKFDKNIGDFNKECLEYYEHLKNVHNINFKNWNVFHKLYKYDSFGYYILNFIILNIPLIGKCIFNIRKAFLHVLRIYK